ncbi:MAG: hypothetical protein Q8906_06035 [Bacillota bacterium]|nr:hypothetical protein [Bacillota bacterium]
MIKVDEKQGKRLRELVELFDQTTDFGKEMIFCFLLGYCSATTNDTKFQSVKNEITKWID